ncbi:hypothetical protein K438DRAFT_1977554 [Mycena galopus ATCC 62051]|nr:hypothetical protein K438DRAFT_1977554 [Mycena galopus ATCC 62051]
MKERGRDGLRVPVNTRDIYRCSVYLRIGLARQYRVRQCDQYPRDEEEIIFIGKIDSIMPKHEKTNGKVERPVVPQLLTLMDAATNQSNAIDPALRRFSHFNREQHRYDPTGGPEILRMSTWSRGTSALTLPVCSEAAMQQIREKMDLIDIDQDTIDAEVLDSLGFRFTLGKSNLLGCARLVRIEMIFLYCNNFPRAANDTVNPYNSSLLSLTLCAMPAHHLIGLVPHTNGTRALNPEDSELANATAPSPGPDVHEINLSHKSEPMQDEFLSFDEFIKPYLSSLEESVLNHHNFPANMSFSDSEEEHIPNRAFTIPDQNATPHTLRKAVVESHKLLGAAIKQNKALAAQVAELKASKPAGRRKTKEAVSSEAYDSVIINLGKSFTLLHFPWVDSTAFTEQAGFPDASPTEIWKAQPPSALFPKHLTAMLFQHIPNEYHSHVATPARFGTLFCHHASTGRSTALKVVKENLPRIALSLKIILDVNDHSAWGALVLWPDDMGKGLKCARALLFGPASLNNNGSARPRGVTLGQMWHLIEPTPGLVAFVCTMVVFVCYWSSVPGDTYESFEPVGTTSKINWREVYMRFRWALESKADEESTKAIMSFWHKHLFKGITGVPSLPPTRSVASEYIDEEAELEDAMGNMSLSSDDEGSTRPDNLVAQRHAHPAPPADVNEDLDESLASPLRPINQRAHPAPPADVDEDLDESLASPLRPINQRAHPAPPADADEEVDEPVGFPPRPINQRAHGRHIIDSEDEGALEDVGGRPADLRLGLEDKLKKLKVLDLKAILQDAERPLRAKAVKNELIASIMADDAAIQVYLARFPI